LSNTKQRAMGLFVQVQPIEKLRPQRGSGHGRRVATQRAMACNARFVTPKLLWRL
jgi:hypothetical protein